MQKEPNASDPNESSICEIQSALEKLIVEGQHAWSPYISSWSLHTLGALSKKYNRFDNRGMYLFVKLKIFFYYYLQHFWMLLVFVYHALSTHDEYLILI